MLLDKGLVANSFDWSGEVEAGEAEDADMKPQLGSVAGGGRCAVRETKEVQKPTAAQRLEAIRQRIAQKAATRGHR